MRVGIFDPYLDTLSGGERYMLTIASCLSKNNEVILFWDDETIIQKAKHKFSLPLDTLKVARNIFSPDVPLLTRLKESHTYDAIFFLSDGSLPIIAAKKNIIHFQFPVEWVKTSLVTKLKMNMVTEVICNSRYTKEFIDKKYGCKSLIVYPPVHLLHKVPLAEKENKVLTVGRFSSLPNGDDFKKLRFMIEAFKRLQSKDWEFIIVTSAIDTEKNGLEELRTLTKGQNITILESVPEKELRTVYEQAKIYWHAAGYREDTRKYPDRVEHFGISTVEAMSAGCIPIVINAGGQKEIIQNGVNGFLWNSEEELIEKTREVISGKAKEITIDHKILEEKFGEERFCNEITKLLT